MALSVLKNHKDFIFPLNKSVDLINIKKNVFLKQQENGHFVIENQSSSNLENLNVWSTKVLKETFGVEKVDAIDGHYLYRIKHLEKNERKIVE